MEGVAFGILSGVSVLDMHFTPADMIEDLQG